MGDARETHLQDFLSTPFAQKGVCDEWFVDDGQCFVRPMLFDQWLRALDSRPGPPLVPHGAALPSATPRAPPGSCVHPSEFTSSADGTPPTFVTLSSFSALIQAQPALGSAFGSREQINARAWESVRACHELRSAINGVDHAPTELVLTRQCADVSKLTYPHAHQWGHTGPRSVRIVRRATPCFCQQLSVWRPAGSLLVAGHHWCVGWRLGITHSRNCGSAGLRGEPHLSRGHHGGSLLRGHWGLSSNDHGGV